MERGSVGSLTERGEKPQTSSGIIQLKIKCFKFKQNAISVLTKVSSVLSGFFMSDMVLMPICTNYFNASVSKLSSPLKSRLGKTLTFNANDGNLETIQQKHNSHNESKWSSSEKLCSNLMIPDPYRLAARTLS